MANYNQDVRHCDSVHKTEYCNLDRDVFSYFVFTSLNYYTLNGRLQIHVRDFTVETVFIISYTILNYVPAGVPFTKLFMTDLIHKT